MIFNEPQVILKSRFAVEDDAGFAGQGSLTAVVPNDSVTASFTSNFVVRHADGRAFHVRQKGTVDILTGEVSSTLLDANCIRF